MDSSSLAKRYLKEKGSDLIDEILQQADELCVSTIAYPEVLSALNRTLREKILSDQEYLQLKELLILEFLDMSLIDVDQNISLNTESILESSYIRGMDAIHVSCAKYAQVDLFISSDKRQLEAARLCGLVVRQI